jgi:hypothetical protein
MSIIKKFNIRVLLLRIFGYQNNKNYQLCKRKFVKL